MEVEILESIRSLIDTLRVLTKVGLGVLLAVCFGIGWLSWKS